MAKTNFDADIDLNENQLLGLVLELFDNLTMPATAREGRLVYNIVKKLPLFHNGFGFESLVTETYVNALLGGLAWKDDVEAASGVNVPLVSLVDGVVIDDIILGDGSRVLLFGQTDDRENGVWVIGSPAERSYDLDDSLDFNNAVIPVKDGTLYKGWQFRCSSIDPDVGIDSIIFKDMTPSVPDASETVKGKLKLALLSAVLAGVEGDTAVTPVTLKGALDPIWNQLSALAPSPPEGLAGRSLVMALYTALEESTGVTRSCIDDDTPDGSIADFYDGDNGELVAEVDGVPSGNQVLSTASDIGVYGALNIIDDSDPIPPGEIGNGLYKQLSAFIRSTGALSLGGHTYKMIHTLTGETGLLTFYVDNPGSVTITGVEVVLPTVSLWVSGVPSLDVGDSISVDFLVNNAVKAHYNSIRLARLQGVQTQSRNIVPPGTPPSNGAVVTYLDEIVQVLTASYSENIQVAISGFNSKDVQGAIINANTNSRVDTMSNETIRKEAGNGEYPAAGYGGAYNSTFNLRTSYTEELQLLNGKYQWPDDNYSANLPVAGPDYSAGMGALTRWVLFDFGINLSNASSFILNIIDTEGTWEGIETEGLKIQAKVAGVTGWLDGNSAFQLIGAPSNDGDAAMVYADSNETQKKISFGNVPRSGLLLIRIGLPPGSDKKFGQDVNISDIV